MKKLVTIILILVVILVSTTAFTPVKRTTYVQPSLNSVGTINTVPYSNTAFTVQRKVWYANGLWWVFGISIDSNYTAGYSTSPDGVNWTAHSLGNDMNTTAEFTSYYDGTYFYYATCLWDGVGYVYFGKGILNSDGTISWLSRDQLVASDAGTDGSYAGTCIWSITVDINGHAFVSYVRQSDGAAVVVRDANTDGTWLTDKNGEYVLDSTPSACVSLVPLTSGQAYALTENGAGFIYNNGWKKESTPMTGVYWEYSVVSHSGIVEATYLNGTTLRCATRSTAGRWTYVNVYNAGANFAMPIYPILSIKGTSDLVYTIATLNGASYSGKFLPNSIYSLERVNGTWNVPTLLISEPASLMHDTDWLSGSYQVQSNQIGISYSTGAEGQPTTALKFIGVTIK